MAARGLKEQFVGLGIVEKFIAVNVLVFIISGLFLGLGGSQIGGWFALPKDFLAFIQQPWSLVTYSFFHAGFWHLFQNMLVLYFSGRIALSLFDNNTFLNVYLLGVIFGGLFFLLGYNLFPTLVSINAVLIGASAGVSAVLIFVCTYIPNKEVRIYILNVKLWHVGAFWVLMNLFQISGGQNVGGVLAHLGGAFLGYFYARQLTKGNNIGLGLNKVYDSIGDLFKKNSKKASMKTVYKKTTQQKSKAVYEKEVNQRKIDGILDKISKSGYESLSKDEKNFLFKAGKDK